MPYVNETAYLLEKYGQKQVNQHASTVDVAKRLANKYAGPSSPTLPSAKGPNDDAVSIPKAPKVPIIQDIESTTIEDPWSDEPEPVTPRLEPNVVPQSLMMGGNPDDHERITMRPEQLASSSEFRTKLITALEAMSSRNVITPLHKQRTIQEIQRATHNAHVVHILQEVRKELTKAEAHAVDYAEQMRKILKSIA